MSIREDWLQRTIKQLAGALARVAGLRRKGRTEEALEATRALAGELVGMERDLLDALEASSAARMLGPERTEVYARLLEEDAVTLDGAGRGPEAQGSRARATALRAVTPR